MRFGSGQVLASGSSRLEHFLFSLFRMRNVSEFTGIILGIKVKRTAFGIKRIIFISEETWTKTITNAILFYVTKIICQIYSDVTGEEVGISKTESPEIELKRWTLFKTSFTSLI